MNTLTNNILKYAIIIGLGIITFIPLYVANSLFFPFITGKAFLFRRIVEIIFALWLILVLREKGTSITGTEGSVAPRKNALTVAVTVFTVIVLVADILGVNPLRSIWSNSERMEGWITIVHLWAYFMVLSSVLTSKKSWHYFFNFVLASGFITAIYGLFQFFGWAEIHQGASRLDASLGNSAYMAVYMIINAFIAGYMAFVSYGKRAINKISATILVSVYTILFVLFSFIIYETETRGSILGLIGGILTACAFYAIFGRSKIENGQEKGQSNISRIISGGVIVLVIVLGVLFYFNKNANWIQKSPTLSRLASISIADTKTQGRAFIWPVAVKESFSSVRTSLIGTGQESFNYYFNKDYNPLMYGQEQWFDRAHSVYLDWLTASGLLGLLAYLALYVISLFYIWKSDLTIGQKSMFVALLTAYGIHNVFVFDNQTSYVMFFTVLAFIHSFKSGKICTWLGSSSKQVSEDYIVVRDYIFVPVIVIAFAVLFYFVNIRNIQANTRLITALRSCSGNSTPIASLFSDALSLNQTTESQEIREQLITCAENVLTSNNMPSQTKKEFYDLSKSEINKQIASTPNDARIYVLGGSLFNSVGDWATALPLLEKAHQLTPGKQSVDFDLATNYMNTGRSVDAVNITKIAYESAVDYALAKTAYVTALINNGQEDTAHKLFPNNPELFTDQRVISTYMKNKQYDKAIAIYKELLTQTPEDLQTRFYLAVAYLSDKENSLAIEQLKTIEDKSPQTKAQIDPIIQQVEAGKDILGGKQ